MNAPLPDNLIDQLLASVREENIPAAKAIQYVDQVLSTFRKIGLNNQDQQHTLVVLDNIAESYEVLSSLEKATEIYLEVLELARSQQNTEHEANILLKIGRVYRKRNRWEEALTYLTQSKQRFDADTPGLAWCWISEGLIKSSQGHYDEAVDAFRYGLEIGEKHQEDRIIAASTMNMGNIDSIRGNFDQAILLFKNSLNIYQQLESHTQQAFVFHNLGMCFTATSNYPSALDSFEKSLEIAQEKGDLILTALNYVHKAVVYLELNDRTLVATYCARSLDTFREVDYPLGIAETYKVLGRLYTQTQDWTTAKSLLSESLRLCEQYEKPLGVAEVQREIGRLHLAQNETDLARTHLEIARDQFTQLGAQHDVSITNEILQTS